MILVATGIASAATEDVLQGEVNYSDRLPPVESYLRSGVSFDPNVLKKTSTTIQWFNIPEWLAGAWALQNQSLTRLYKQDLKTGEKTSAPYEFKAERASIVLGHQTDKLGGIWHCAAVPYNRETYYPQSDETEKTIVVLIKPIKINKDKAVIEYRSKRVRVNKKTGKIVKCTQDESLQTYTRMDRNRIKCSGVIKQFDQDGNAIAIYHVAGVSDQIQPFTPVAELRGNDLVTLFREYLTMQGLTDIIPD